MKQKIITFVILLVLIVGAGVAVNRLKTSPTATLNASTIVTSPANNNQYATTTVKVGSKTFQVELATTVDQQALGLGNRDTLAKNAGMLFVFKPAETATFWMKDMRFPLDMVWIYQGRVIAVDRNLPIPASGTKQSDLPIYSPKTLIDYVLEVNAGAAASIKAGDSFELTNSSSV